MFFTNLFHNLAALLGFLTPTARRLPGFAVELSPATVEPDGIGSSLDPNGEG